jgi:hypothetical protein
MDLQIRLQHQRNQAWQDWWESLSPEQQRQIEEERQRQKQETAERDQARRRDEEQARLQRELAEEKRRIQVAREHAHRVETISHRYSESDQTRAREAHRHAVELAMGPVPKGPKGPFLPVWLFTSGLLALWALGTGSGFAVFLALIVPPAIRLAWVGRIRAIRAAQHRAVADAVRTAGRFGCGQWPCAICGTKLPQGWRHGP